MKDDATRELEGEAKVSLLLRCLWFALLIFCVLVGIYTRLSYTDIATNPTRFATTPYNYLPAHTTDQNLEPESKRATDLDADIDALISQSPIIIECVFEGNRRYLYQSFPSDVRILTRLKGDGIQAGQIMQIFEPVQLVNEAGKAHYATPSGMYDCGYTMMKEGAKYLVFLSAKEYPAEENRIDKHTEYVFQEHPYAKISIGTDTGGGVYVASDEQMTVGEASTYEIVVSTSEDAKLFDIKKKMLLEATRVTADPFLQ
ncbi:MAG: hypothetical protein LBU07_04880 [Coriobacteriales bacterium]|jgi:hypothetical protein|nr:hypothetical protein [Coriobacteriales bacterium]